MKEFFLNERQMSNSDIMQHPLLVDAAILR